MVSRQARVTQLGIDAWIGVCLQPGLLFNSLSAPTNQRYAAVEQLRDSTPQQLQTPRVSGAEEREAAVGTTSIASLSAPLSVVASGFVQLAKCR